MKHRHALHAGLATVAAFIGLCCSSAAPVPPPPPPEPAPVAAPAATVPRPAAPPAPVASAAPAARPECPTDCKGQVTPALASALRARATGGKACYQRALREAGVKGSGMVRVTVAPSGVACRADVDLPLDLNSMESCLKELFAGSSFPPPTNGCARVNIPVNFELSERDGGADASPSR